MKPSVILAQEHFVTKVLPRRIAEEVVTTKKDGRQCEKTKYRRASRNDEGGHLYPYFDLSFKSMAQFGLGVSVYLLQLLIIAAISFTAGAIMLPAIVGYVNSDRHGSSDPRISGTAACGQVVVVNATEGCSSKSMSCSVDYREDCNIPEKAVVADIAMCLFIVIVMYFNMFIDHVEDRLDEAIQTSQDYSVVVNDPVADACDPDEYRDFFGRFGRVRNVTVAKKNKPLIRLLLKKRMILRKLNPRMAEQVQDKKEFPNMPEQSCWLKLKQSMGFGRDHFYWIRILCELNKKIEEVSKIQFPVSRVYVSFESEYEQRLCLKELGVSKLESIYDIGGRGRTKFRNADVLSVVESAEPNNILWLHLDNSTAERLLRKTAGWFLAGAAMAISYYVIQYTFVNYPLFVPMAIGGLDLLLPQTFIYITAVEEHVDEDDRQNSLLFKLYAAKLLTAVVFNFVNTAWPDFLNEIEIVKIINIQLSASFVSPFVKVLDLPGLVNRWFISRILSTTQAQMNQYWEGSQFTLADRYTEISKIMFISLFYSILTPTALFVSCVACLVLFAVDRFLLLRKTKIPPMLDATMASTIREYILFAVAVHMYVTTRFIYSWPLDSAYEKGDVIHKVNKTPPYRLWTMSVQSWHSNSQASILHTYKWTAIVVILFIAIVIFIEPMYKFLKSLFFNEAEVETSKGSKKLYSEVRGIIAYCPIILHRTEKFIAADTSEMLARHRPETVVVEASEDPNLASMVPRKLRRHLFAVVKWYPPDKEMLESSLQDAESDELYSGILSSALKSSLGINNESGSLFNRAAQFSRPLRRDLKVSATKTQDVLHVDIECGDVVTATPAPTGEESKETTSVLNKDREVSRIRKSMAAISAQRKANKIVAPSSQFSSAVAESSPAPAKEANSFMFTREEVYLLRQMRKELIGLSAESIYPRNRGRTENYPTPYLSYDDFLNTIQHVAPESLVRTRTATKTRKEDAIRYNRTLLRRIFMKFMTLQRDAGSKVDTDGVVDWPIFLSFVQTGAVIEMQSLSDANKAERQSSSSR